MKKKKKLFRKIISVVLIVVLIGIWSLSDLARIPFLNFPKKIEETKAATTTVFLTTADTSPWTVPDDWTNTNSIEVISGGGGGVDAANGAGSGGGGGGAYAKSTNISLTPGSTVGFSVGVGGSGAATPTAGGNTWFCNSTTNCASYTDTAVVVSADGGNGGSLTTGGAGGDLTGVTNAATEFAGGAGGTGSGNADSGGGGGGSAGPGGAGKNGGDGSAAVDTTQGAGGGGGAGGGSSTAGSIGTATGGNGGAGPTGTAGGTGGSTSNGNPGSNGSGGGGSDNSAGAIPNGGLGGNGTEWDSSHGAGGGGGGGSNSDGGNNGGLYGGGGAGGETGAGNGAAGLIVITYTQANVTVAATGTQTASMDANSVNQYIGGAFTFVRDNGSVNVTQIVVTETDASFVAQTYLSNLDLYYETAATCTFDGTETLFGTATSFNASEKATVTGTISVGTSQVCVYAVVDVASGAPTGDSFDIEITNPSTEVTVSLGTVSPSTAVAITGATSIAAAQATFAQNHYRWYVDPDAENVTDPWSSSAGIDLAEDTALTPIPVANDPPNTTQELRLRVNITVNTSTITSNTKYFKLQHRTGTDSDCSTGSWTDVGTGAWAYASSTVTDDTTLTVAKLTGTDRLETYSKVKPANTPTATTVTGEDIEYDFHIIGSSATSATRYLFRVVETTSDGTGTTTLASYGASCPVLHTEPGVEDQMRHGNFFSGSTEQGFFWAD